MPGLDMHEPRVSVCIISGMVSGLAWLVKPHRSGESNMQVVPSFLFSHATTRRSGHGFFTGLEPHFALSKHPQNGSPPAPGVLSFPGKNKAVGLVDLGALTQQVLLSADSCDLDGSFSGVNSCVAAR